MTESSLPPFSDCGGEAEGARLSRVLGRIGASLCLLCCGALGGNAFGKDHKIPLPEPAFLESAARDFTPPGWRAETEIAGDLNRDGKLDAVLQLVEQKSSENPEEERRRMLLVLLRARDGNLKIVARGERLLRCAGCQGVYAEGGAPEIRIVKGVLVVRESWGARETGETVLRFRYDSASAGMTLIGEELAFDDRATGARGKESVDWLTGVKIVEKNVYDSARDRPERTAKRKSRVARLKKRLDEVDYRDYEKRVERLQR